MMTKDDMIVAWTMLKHNKTCSKLWCNVQFYFLAFMAGLFTIVSAFLVGCTAFYKEFVNYMMVNYVYELKHYYKEHKESINDND